MPDVWSILSLVMRGARNFRVPPTRQAYRLAWSHLLRGNVTAQLVERPSIFFLGLTGIAVPSIPMPGLRIGNNLRIMRDSSAAGRMIGTYADRMGSLEAEFLQHRASALIYAHEKIMLDLTCAPEWINGLLIQRLAEVRSWLMGLWLIKDNGVDPDVGWMAVAHEGDSILNNNHWTAAYSKADGSAGPTTFSKEEISKASTFPIAPENLSEGRAVPLYVAGASEQKVTKLSHGSLRVQRFLYFVDGARGTRDVAIKIANYCSGLEAMVSTSHTELTHQVAERVAVLLHPSGSNRLETFRKIKEAYGMRSKAVHGAVFREKDQAQLKKLSVEIDQISREVTLAYLTQPDFEEALKGSSEAFTEFWMRKLFL